MRQPGLQLGVDTPACSQRSVGIPLHMSPERPTVSGYLVLAAEEAGSTDGQVIRQVVELLGGDAPTELRTTTDREDLESALDDLAGRRLVVAGGDGSVHLVVGSLVARGRAAAAAVGLVPLGTGNDLAQSLGVPLDPVHAARRVLTGQARAVDLLGCDEDVAVNAAHTGFGVGAARRAQPLKPALGPLAYRLGAVWAGVAQGSIEATVAVDGRPVCEDEPLLLVAVMNGSSVGGGTPLCPPADPCDGLLDVVVATDRGRVKRAAFALALSRGRHLQLPGVIHRQGRRVSVRVTEETWNIDGELTATRPALEWQAQPAAWQVLA